MKMMINSVRLWNCCYHQWSKLMEPYLQQVAYERMLEDLKRMGKAGINEQLLSMGCEYDYDQLKEKLSFTYNDLSVADEVFSCFTIVPKQYPVTFIDEVVLEIARRENFGFLHYGILSADIHVIINLECALDEKLTKLESCYRKLCSLAHKFGIASLEAMQYQANDGIDIYAILMEALDQMLQLGSNDTKWYQQLIRFCDKLLSTFVQSSPYIRSSIQYEQATAYIALKSKKGDQIFIDLLKSHVDSCDVVLHYVLAYLDDEKKAMRILQMHQQYVNKDSDAYEVLMSIVEDMKK